MTLMCGGLRRLDGAPGFFAGVPFLLAPGKPSVGKMTDRLISEARCPTVSCWQGAMAASVGPNENEKEEE